MNPTPAQNIPNQGGFHFGPVTQNSQKPANSNPTPMFTFNIQKEDEFGGFDSGHQENKWMSAAESNLTDLTELGK